MFEIYDFKNGPLKLFADTFMFDFKNNNLPWWLYRKDYPKVPFGSHNHADPEALYVRRGSIRIFVNDVPYTLRENELLIVNPYDTHRGYFTDADYLEYSYVIFDLSIIGECGKRIENLISEIRYGIRRFSPILRGEDADRIGEIIYKLALLRQSATAGRLSVTEEIQAESMVFSIFSELINHVELKRLAKKPYDTDFIKEVSIYIECNYKSPLTTARVSSELGYSKNYFCTLFKANFGQSFSNYLCEYRIKRSLSLAKLFTDNSLPLSAIAAMVGFTDYCYFSRSFTRYIGVPPSVYFKG